MIATTKSDQAEQHNYLLPKPDERIFPCCSIELCLSESYLLEFVVKYQVTIAVVFLKESERIYKSHCTIRGAQPLRNYQPNSIHN